jgi:hypothetical protein
MVAERVDPYPRTAHTHTRHNEGYDPCAPPTYKCMPISFGAQIHDLLALPALRAQAVTDRLAQTDRQTDRQKTTPCHRNRLAQNTTPSTHIDLQKSTSGR